MVALQWPKIRFSFENQFVKYVEVFWKIAVIYMKMGEKLKN